MPSEQVHRLVALENEVTALALLDLSPKWAVIVAFYAALHWVDALLDHVLGAHPADHHRRSSFVTRVGSLRPIADNYRTLRDRAQTARYDGVRVSRTEAASLIQNELDVVKTMITSVIGP